MGELTGVMLMAYGTPRNLGEVEAYFRSIRGGRQPSPEEVENLTERYRRVGGKTPLAEITQEVAEALEKRLNGDGDGHGHYKTYVGMKHWHPFINETLSEMVRDGVRRIIALPLAPHYSQMSIGGYRTAVEDGLRSLEGYPETSIVENWHENPLFVQTMVGKIGKALPQFTGQEDLEVLFSAHSLPSRIRLWDDPYERELLASCEAVAKAAGLTSWGFAFQSAGHTGERWLGPDILEAIGSLAGKGVKRVLVVSIGFVSDNLEIIYDLDVETRELAQGLGIELRRTEMPNTSPDFIDALADIVRSGRGARLSQLRVEAIK